MAITELEYTVLRSFREHHLLPERPRVIELGESNWYGDVSIDRLIGDISRLVTDPEKRRRGLDRAKEILSARRPGVLYEIASLFWDTIVAPASYDAIDPGTPGSRYRFDLNLPVPLTETFDLTINIGTAEHVFNVQQFFKTAHDLTTTGGLMMHSSPFTGWPDHGFYSFHPTFFFDLARENGYQMLSLVAGRIDPFEYVQIASHADVPKLIAGQKIPHGAHLNVVYRKTTAAEFRVPNQAYYAGALSPESQRSWHELR